MHPPKRITVPLLAAACLFLFAVAAISYAVGYFALSAPQVTERDKLLRVYSSEWLAEAYTPMACAEEAVRGQKLLLGWRR